MKCVQALSLPYVNKLSPLREVSSLLNGMEKNKIETVPWPSFTYKPKVTFTIAYNYDCIFIKYFVQEHSIKVGYVNTNDPVYKDSCVEFFISFNNEASYYNFEFNCIGTCLVGFGYDRDQRSFLSVDVVDQIRHLAVIKSSSDKATPLISWELTLIIPSDVFIHHKLSNLKGLTCRTNFFKCGDELPEPHFLAWTDIKADEPNFHLPQFFGAVHFT